MVKVLAVFLASLAMGCAAERSAIQVKSSNQAAANPMRRVVTMLQMMQKKVEAEGEKEKELFEKFFCYCTSGAATLSKSISDADVKMPQLASDITEAESTRAQLVEDLAGHQSDRTAAKEAMATATAAREKEAAAFAKEDAESKANIAALTKATAAIEKGMSGGFLQTSAAGLLRKLALTQEMSNEARNMLTDFLAGSSAQGYAPASGEIVGILKQLGDTMDKDLADLVADENAAKKSYDELMAAKQAEVDSLTKAIEEKTKRVGEIGVELVNMKEDLDDTTKSHMDDTKFLADLDKNCALKKKEQAALEKTRQEELLALADTIKMLNDDDALELFKKTLPSASFMQLQVSTKQVTEQALRALAGLRRGGHHNASIDLIAMALRGKKVDMSKVVAMIDDMVVLLGKEQGADDDKKAYCLKEFDESDDKKKALERSISDLEKFLAEAKEGVETLTAEIAALHDGILKLDREVAGATEQRKEEHEEFVAVSAGNNAAMGLIEMAKNRMNKFYNPKLYKEPAPAAAELEQQGAAPGAAPETPGAYKKKGEESGGVIAMMDGLKADLAKETQELELTEKDAQADYEQMVNDAAEKRGADSKSIAEKEGAKAGLEGEIVKETDHKSAEEAELMATKQYIAELHADCDWLIDNYETRKSARANEIDALKKAKAVLGGADYSLVQTSHRAALQRHL